MAIPKRNKRRVCKVVTFGRNSLSKTTIMKKLKKKKKKTASKEDRISDLPDSILHHILSFLDMKQVVRTSVVSPRWRYLWKSMPVLNFDHSFWLMCYSYKFTFMNFVSKVLKLHDLCTNVHKFHLSASYCYSTSLIVQWVTTALQLGAQEICLEIGNYRAYMELPHDLFSSPIMIFKLKLECSFSKLPDSICYATHLKILHLEGARFPNGNSDGELVLSCPVLEDLVLRSCDHGQISILNISALQLRSLIIESGDISLVRSCKLKICTPRLASFHCQGLVYKDYLLEDLSTLVSAKIGSRALMHRFEKKVHPQNLVTVLSSVCIVETLELSIQWTKRFLQVQDIVDESPLTFHNLRCLKLIWCYDSFHVIANLLRSSPSLETLILEISEGDTTTDNIKELSFQGVFYQPKFVEIHNFRGYKMEFKLLEILLENAMALERITITAKETIQELSRNEEMNLEDFKENLHFLARASSVEILFSYLS